MLFNGQIKENYGQNLIKNPFFFSRVYVRAMPQVMKTLKEKGGSSHGKEDC